MAEEKITFKQLTELTNKDNKCESQNDACYLLFLETSSITESYNLFLKDLEKEGKTENTKDQYENLNREIRHLRTLIKIYDSLFNRTLKFAEAIHNEVDKKFPKSPFPGERTTLMTCKNGLEELIKKAEEVRYYYFKI